MRAPRGVVVSRRDSLIAGVALLACAGVAIGWPSRAPRAPVEARPAEVPSAAVYRLFLDFQHGDTVRTAEFTVPSGDPPHTHAAGDGGHR